MPIYEYACLGCERVVSILVRNMNAKGRATCPECGEIKLHRIISNFAFHQSVLSKMEQLDPKYDKMIDAASPDLSFDNLVKKYNLDAPVPKSEA